MTVKMLLYIIAMASVTYLIRMIPFTLFQRKIKNRFFLSFFHYIPYSVLGAMTVPWIFYSTSSFITAAAGTVCALILSYFNRSLITVALSSCAAAYICSLLVSLV